LVKIAEKQFYPKSKFFLQQPSILAKPAGKSLKRVGNTDLLILYIIIIIVAIVVALPRAKISKQNNI
jgi:hypothetical protein